MGKHLKIKNKLCSIRGGVISRYRTWNQFLLLANYPVLMYVAYYAHHNVFIHQIKHHLLHLGGKATVLTHSNRVFFTKSPSSKIWEFVSKGNVIVLAFSHLHSWDTFMSGSYGAKTLQLLPLITLSINGLFVNIHKENTSINSLHNMRSSYHPILVQLIYKMCETLSLHYTLNIVVFHTLIILLQLLNIFVYTIVYVSSSFTRIPFTFVTTNP